MGALYHQPSSSLFPPSQTSALNQINMSMPQNNNQGIVGQAMDSATNAANYAKDTVPGTGAEAKKEAGKEQAKGNAGGGSLSDRVSGAAGAVSGKVDESKYNASSEANKRSI